jgi:Amt family ammonium transporter
VIINKRDRDNENAGIINIFKQLIMNTNTTKQRLLKFLPLLVMIILFFVVIHPGKAFAQAPDPSGTHTGTIKDVPAAKAGAPTLNEVADAVGHNRIALNIMWTLLTGFLVMFMQVGFAMVETGFTRAKNVAHTMAMNLFIYIIGITGFWICGFAFMFGGVGAEATLGGTPGLTHEITLHLFGKDFGLVGSAGYFLNSKVYDVGVFTLFLFQMVFMDTAATIPTGAMAERWKFKSFAVYGLFISMFVYPIYGNWVWGGGWLANLGTNFGLGHGAVDFAGSSVVHLVGGVAALAGVIVLGPRLGKYNKDGSVNTIPGHNIPMAVVGTLILAFGWFGFNPGSTLAGSDLRIAIVATNTMIASASGGLFATLYMWIRFKKPEVGVMGNGLLGGLVAITAPCAFVNATSAFIIGGLAGLFVVVSTFFIDQKLKLDDPVGAMAVHGVCGIWGVLAVGLFADGQYGDGWNGVKGPVTGWFYGDHLQIVAQLITCVTCVVFVFVAMFTFFKICNKTMGIRSRDADEIIGLDENEIGLKGYDDDVTPVEHADITNLV